MLKQALLSPLSLTLPMLFLHSAAWHFQDCQSLRLASPSGSPDLPVCSASLSTSMITHTWLDHSTGLNTQQALNKCFSNESLVNKNYKEYYMQLILNAKNHPFSELFQPAGVLGQRMKSGFKESWDRIPTLPPTSRMTLSLNLNEENNGTSTKRCHGHSVKSSVSSTENRKLGT